MKNLHSQISSVFGCLDYFRYTRVKGQKCPEGRRELLATRARPDARGEGRRPATSDRHSDESPGPPRLRPPSRPGRPGSGSRLVPVPGCRKQGLQAAGRGEGAASGVHRGGKGGGGGQRPTRRGREGRRSAADARRGGRDADRRMKGPRAPGSTAQEGGEEAGGRRPMRQGGEKVGAWVERRAGEGR
jgi:hypothetical protein